jgi:hypothetical protein
MKKHIRRKHGEPALSLCHTIYKEKHKVSQSLFHMFETLIGMVLNHALRKKELFLSF